MRPLTLVPFAPPWQARRNSSKVGFWKQVMDPALDEQCPPKAAKLFAALAVGMCATVSNCDCETMGLFEELSLEAIEHECSLHSRSPRFWLARAAA